MRLKTILNRIEKHQGFLYDAVRLEEEDGRLVIEVAIRPRAHSRPTCSGCQQPGSGYHSLPAHWFAFVSLWGLPS